MKKGRSKTKPRQIVGLVKFENKKQSFDCEQILGINGELLGYKLLSQTNKKKSDYERTY